MTYSIQDLHKSYSQGSNELKILKGVKLDVDQGKTVAILGPSGSGKSTLLAMMAGLDRPTKGSIFLDGKDLTKMNQSELTSFRAKNLSIIFQQFHLISHLTALENVMLAAEIINLDNGKNIKEKAYELLKRVGLSERSDHFPHQLSGGECQRVAMARALIVSPKIILADEPSGSLDEKTGLQVMDLFFELVQKENMTTILVTHSQEVAKRCSRRLSLHDGLLNEI